MAKAILLMLFIAGCTTLKVVDAEKEREQLLLLHKQQRENHFKKNATGMIASSTDSFYVIDRGAVHHPTKEAQVKRFTQYFNSVEFVKWDDKKDPLIRFSDDRTVAYVAVEKLVILKAKNKSGIEVMDTSHYAWMSVYRKIKGKWLLDAIASTNK